MANQHVLGKYDSVYMLGWKRIAALLDYETKDGGVTRRGTVEGWKEGEVNF